MSAAPTIITPSAAKSIGELQRELDAARVHREQAEKAYIASQTDARRRAALEAADNERLARLVLDNAENAAREAAQAEQRARVAALTNEERELSRATASAARNEAAHDMIHALLAGIGEFSRSALGPLADETVAHDERANRLADVRRALGRQQGIDVWSNIAGPLQTVRREAIEAALVSAGFERQAAADASHAWRGALEHLARQLRSFRSKG